MLHSSVCICVPLGRVKMSTSKFLYSGVCHKEGDE